MNNGLFLSTGTAKSAIPEKKPGRKHKVKKDVTELMLSLLLMASVIILFSSVCGISFYLIPVLFFGVVVCALMWFEWERKTTVYMILGAVFGLFLFGFLIGNEYALNCLLVCFNRFADTIGRSDLTILDKYKVTAAESAYQLYATFTLMFAAGLVAVISVYSILERQYLYIYIFTMIMAFLLIRYRLNLSIAAAAFYLFTVFAVFFHASNRRIKRSALIPFAAVIAVIGLSVFITGKLDRLFQIYRSPYERIYDSINYSKNTSDGYQEGRIAGKRVFSSAGGTAFRITMSHPKIMYLKGFVGAEFNGVRWLALDNEKVYDSRELFYLLDKNHFNPLYQSASFYGLTGAKAEYDVVNIEYAGCNNKYFLLPYETAALDHPGGAEIRADQLVRRPEAEKSYQFYVTKTLYTDMLSLREAYNENLVGEDYEIFKVAESNYSDYAHKTYMDVPQQYQETLAALLEKYEVIEEEAINYRKTTEIVKEILNAELSYDKSETLSVFDENIVETLITKDKKGYDIHFATLAALLFRTMGYPARYVEGYIITPADALKMKSGESYAVNGNAAHAWTEVYVESIGWMPVEVIEEYEKTMFPAQAASGENAEPENTAGNNQTSNVFADTEYENAGATPVSNAGSVFRRLIITAVIFVLLVLLVFIRRLIIIKQRMRLIEGADKNAAIFACYDHLYRILSVCGCLNKAKSQEKIFAPFEETLEESASKDLKEFLAICEKAAFSGDKATEAEASFVHETGKKFIELITERQKLLKNIWLYLIEGVSE